MMGERRLVLIGCNLNCEMRYKWLAKVLMML